MATADLSKESFEQVIAQAKNVDMAAAHSEIAARGAGV
jgi:hypothetical protein